MLIEKIDRKQVYIDVAMLHINSIKFGFLPSLGVKFLALLYRCVDESDFSTLIVKYKDSKLIGFVTGTTGKSSLFKKMLNHPIELILILCPIILSYKNIKKIIEIWKYMSGIKRSKYPKAELLSICVHEDYQRKGVAIDLYKKLSNYFNAKHIFEFVIIVGEPLEANLFYINQGAKLVDKFQIHGNTNSNLYIQKI